MKHLNSKIKNQPILWLLAAFIWMLVIFFFSAQSGPTSGATSAKIVHLVLPVLQNISFYGSLAAADKASILSLVTWVVRKAAHFTEYAILGIFLVKYWQAAGAAVKRQIGFSVLVCAGYAVTDELHQYFVPGRACALGDVCIDVMGAICGITVFLFVKMLYEAKVHKKS